MNGVLTTMRSAAVIARAYGVFRALLSLNDILELGTHSIRLSFGDKERNKKTDRVNERSFNANLDVLDPELSQNISAGTYKIKTAVLYVRRS